MEACMFPDILTPIERDVLLKPKRGILLLRINAVLIGLCAAFAVALTIGILWSDAGSRIRLNAYDAVLFLLVLTFGGVILGSVAGIWRGDMNAMIVAWIAFAIAMVLKALTLTFTFGNREIDAGALVLAITGFITMRAMLARGFELSNLIKSAPVPD
jgi:hypothetical protein